jgi:hypothetical protein
MPEVPQGHDEVRSISLGEVTADNALLYEPDIIEARRSEIVERTTGDLKRIVPLVLSGDVESVDSLEYPLAQERLESYLGVLAIQRALVLLPSKQAGALREAYRHGSDGAASVMTVAEGLGRSYNITYNLLAKGHEQLASYAGQIMRGTVDYKIIGSKRVPQCPSVLLYFAYFDQRIPTLGSLEDLDHVAQVHFKKTAALAGLDDASQTLVREYYGIGRGGVQEDWKSVVFELLGYPRLILAKAAFKAALHSMQAVA